MDNELKDLLSLSREVIEKLNLKLEESNEKIAVLKEENKTWQMVSSSDDLIDMSEVAKVLNYKGFGRNKLFELLKDMEILRQNKQPYQKYVDAGYFKCIEQKVDLEFKTIINIKTVVTQKGLDYIRKVLDEYTDKPVI